MVGYPQSLTKGVITVYYSCCHLQWNHLINDFAKININLELWAHCSVHFLAH